MFHFFFVFHHLNDYTSTLKRIQANSCLFHSLGSLLMSGTSSEWRLEANVCGENSILKAHAERRFGRKSLSSSSGQFSTAIYSANCRVVGKFSHLICALMQSRMRPSGVESEILVLWTAGFVRLHCNTQRGAIESKTTSRPSAFTSTTNKSSRLSGNEENHKILLLSLIFPFRRLNAKQRTNWN